MKQTNTKSKETRMNPNDYELFTKTFFETRLKEQVGYAVPVLHQKTLKGENEEEYTIDLHYELKIADKKILTLIECKYWNYKVQRRNVNDFRSVIGDLGADKGIIVTKLGFDSGAISIAEKSQVGLYKLTEKEELSIFANWTGTQDNINKAYEFLQSENSTNELKGTFSGLFFSDDTSLYHFLMLRYGAKFGKYLVDYCFINSQSIEDSNFIMPDDIKSILISIDVINLHKEYILFETAGLNLSLANEEFVKATFNMILILQFKTIQLNSK